MITANTFGTTYVYDRRSTLVIYHSRFDELSKFICSAILDTAPVQIPDFELKFVKDPSVFHENSDMVITRKGEITKWIYSVPNEVKEKKKLAKILGSGYYYLLSHAEQFEVMFDHYDVLNSDDVPLYQMYPDEYIALVMKHRNMTLDEAKKHLDFLRDNHVSSKMRKKELILKYGATLKSVRSEDDLKSWRETLIQEVHGVGAV